MTEVEEKKFFLKKLIESKAHLLQESSLSFSSTSNGALSKIKCRRRQQQPRNQRASTAPLRAHTSQTKRPSQRTTRATSTGKMWRRTTFGKIATPERSNECLAVLFLPPPPPRAAFLSVCRSLCRQLHASSTHLTWRETERWGSVTRDEERKEKSASKGRA